MVFCEAMPVVLLGEESSRAVGTKTDADDRLVVVGNCCLTSARVARV